MISRKDFDGIRREYETKYLRLIEEVLRIIKLKEENYARLTKKLIESINLKEQNDLLTRDLTGQNGWIKELESLIPKHDLRKLRKKYDHIFHASMSPTIPDDDFELINP